MPRLLVVRACECGRLKITGGEWVDLQDSINSFINLAKLERITDIRLIWDECPICMGGIHVRVLTTASEATLKDLHVSTK